MERGTILPNRHSCQWPATAIPARRVLERACGECAACEATFWVFSEDRARLDAAINHGATPAKMEGVSVPVAQSVVGMVACTGVGASIGPDDFHNPAAKEAGAAETVAMIAVPVYARGKLVGVLSAINPVGRGLFSPDDLECLSFNAYLVGLIVADTHGM